MINRESRDRNMALPKTASELNIHANQNGSSLGTICGWQYDGIGSERSCFEGVYGWQDFVDAFLCVWRQEGEDTANLFNAKLSEHCDRYFHVPSCQVPSSLSP